MLILGIDPGTTRIGWAILKANNKDVYPLDYGCWEISEKKQGQRLEKIAKNLLALIKKYQPEIMMIEKIFFYNTIISLLIFLNLVMHFFLDSFGFRNGVCLLYPFSKKEYSLTKIQLYQKLSRKELFDLYIHNGNLFLEAYVVVFGGVMLLAF